MVPEFLYLCTFVPSVFVWANRVKIEVFGTYQKIPGTGQEREKRDARRAREREGATGVYERGFARDVFEI